MAEPDILIVGAGIVGICVAANLAEVGRDVLVIDRTGVCEETSSGNAAALAFPDMLPLVQKGMMRQVPKWLMDPLGPLTIPPAYLPRLVPWLVRFWLAGRPANYEAALAAQASMMRLAEPEWLGLMDRSGTRSMLREDGALELYEGEREFEASLPGWEARARHGSEYLVVKAADLPSYQPGLSERFTHGVFMPGWKTVADPKLLGKAIWKHAEAKGARFLKAEAKKISAGDAVTIELADGSTLRAKQTVICAGAWSHRLAAQLGERIPLETERGYNTTLPSSAFDLKRQLIFARHGFVVTPLATGVRVGGAVELGGLSRPPNYARARAMLAKAAQFMPGLKTEGGREWMGYRPSLPDSLPVIGREKNAGNVLYAFGHGHLGLTQSAAAGRLIRDLMLERPAAIDLAPFRSTRF